ncbi:MAG TPA: 3-deoxy-8-phosphooctulonate synthase [Phycisphaerae bacterium]|nr:3-deoxy-8-phosphooctulonate synthase [Phycisphaerae bacterium]
MHPITLAAGSRAASYNPASQFLLIAGPCVIESLDLCLTIAGTVKETCQKLGGSAVIPYVFKASFDKANRSSAKSPRGMDLDKGVEILAAVGDRMGLPVTTDIHESDQAALVAKGVDILQIPAFLCRQTDLLVAAGKTGKPVNIKKGQFMAPWEMANAVEKVHSTGNKGVFLTERGTFFGYNRLVNDMTGIPQMQALGGGTPVIMDATHSTQLPGGLGHATAGQREYVPLLARAATAAGVNGLFVEVHPEPAKSPSDAATILALRDLPRLLEQCMAIRDALVR